MVTALGRAVKRFHVGCAAIKTANLAYEGARQLRGGIDALQLVMEPKGGPVDAREQRLHISRRPGMMASSCERRSRKEALSVSRFSQLDCVTILRLLYRLNWLPVAREVILLHEQGAVQGCLRLEGQYFVWDYNKT